MSQMRRSTPKEKGSTTVQLNKVVNLGQQKRHSHVAIPTQEPKRRTRFTTVQVQLIKNELERSTPVEIAEKRGSLGMSELDFSYDSVKKKAEKIRSEKIKSKPTLILF